MEIIVLIIAVIVVVPIVLYFVVKLFWSIPAILLWILFVATAVILISSLGQGGLLLWFVIWSVLFFLRLLCTFFDGEG